MTSHAKKRSSQIDGMIKKPAVTVAALTAGCLLLACSCRSQVKSDHISHVHATSSAQTQTRNSPIPRDSNAARVPQDGLSTPNLQGGGQGPASPARTSAPGAPGSAQPSAANGGPEPVSPSAFSADPPSPSPSRSSGAGGDPGVPPVTTTASPTQQVPGIPGPAPAPR